MAENKKPFTISKAELAKLPRNEQRRYLDLGYIEVEQVAAKAEAK